LAFLNLGLIALLFVRLVGFTRYTRGRRGQPVTHDGETLYARMTRGKYKTPISFEVSVDVPDRFRFTLRLETWLDRLAKTLGVAREWQTGDKEFDSTVFIVSEDSALLEAMSADPQLRSLLVTLLQVRPSGRIDCGKGRLSFIGKPPAEYRDCSDEVACEQLVQKLHAPLTRVRDRLARIAVGDWQAQRDPAFQRRGWFIRISALIGVAGIIGFFVEFAFDRHQIVRDVIPYWTGCVSATIVGALLVSMLVWLRKTPHTHAVLLDILLVALPGAWFAGYAAFTWYNERYDVAPPVRFAVRVESAYATKHKSRKTYHLVVEKWPDGRGERDLIVPEQESMQLEPGNCVIAIWHPGRLGDSWVSNFERAVAKECYLESVE
jgi:hypothetical protein